MIFADKLMMLRKRSGWSQEELAEEMDVTRQSVSKWEGAQSVPDLEKLVRLSELFGVSLDYLLKDELDELEGISVKESDDKNVKRVSMEEASNFLKIKKSTSKPIAFGVFLCILSPITLMILAVLSERDHTITENMAVGLGLSVLLVLVAVAVGIFISVGMKTGSYQYLDKEIIETEYGVVGMVKDRREKYKKTYTRNNIIGVCFCILAIIPVMLGIILNEQSDVLIICMVGMTLFMVAVGVLFFITSGIVWESYLKLLQEGDYKKTKKENRPVSSAISVVYWLLAVTIFLVYSIAVEDWRRSWIVLMVAGLLFPALLSLVHLFTKKKSMNE